MGIYVKYSFSGERCMANFYLVSWMLFTFHNPQMWKIRNTKREQGFEVEGLDFSTEPWSCSRFKKTIHTSHKK